MKQFSRLAMLAGLVFAAACEDTSGPNTQQNQGRFNAATQGAAGTSTIIEGDWARWLGDGGEFVGMTGFGASAPAETLYREFGITADAVAKAAQRCIARSRMAATGA